MELDAAKMIGAGLATIALFGVGMTVGTLLGGRLADRSVARTVLLGFAMAPTGTLCVLAIGCM